MAPTLLLLLLLLAVWSAFRASVPTTAFRREVVIKASRQVVWDHFSRLREWPSWMRSIRSVEVAPDDTLGPRTVATLVADPMNTTFTMAEFDPPHHWMWTTRMLWFTLLYDHRFEALDAGRTRLTLHMRVTGMGKLLFSRLIDRGSRGAHAAALPLLAAEIENLPSGRPPGAAAASRP